MLTILYLIHFSVYMHTGYQLMAIAIDTTADQTVRADAIDKLEFYPLYVRMSHSNLVRLTEDSELTLNVYWLVFNTYSHAEIVEMLCSISKVKKFNVVFSIDLINTFNRDNQKYATPFEPYVRSLISSDLQHRGKAMMLLERIGCLKPADVMLFHVYLLLGKYEERCAAIVSLHEARYSNYLLLSSTIDLLPHAEYAGDKMDLLGCLKAYGMQAINAMPSAIKLLYYQPEGVQVSAIWLLQALEHHAIRAVPRLLALSLAHPKEYAGQQAYIASVSIIQSWLSYVLRGAAVDKAKRHRIRN